MRDSVTNDQLLKEVENYVSTKLRTGSVTQVHSTTSDNFYTERFLFEAWKTEVIEPDLNILERLCKKADVVRNLYRLYSIDLGQV